MSEEEPTAYQLARDQLDKRDGRRLRHELRKLLSREPIDPSALFGPLVDWAPYLLQIDLPGTTTLLLLATTELRTLGPAEAHVQVRAVEVDEEGEQTGRLPTWAELVLVRSLAWLDDAEVSMVMPPASKLADGVLHMFGPVRS